MRVEAAGIENIQDDAARVNGTFLYVALEELRVLREFQEQEYRQHPKFHHNVVMHLFDTALPRSVYETRSEGAGRDTLRFTRLESTVADHGTSIDRLETAIGSVRQGLGLPAAGSRRRRGGGGGPGRGVTEEGGVVTFE